MRAARSTRRFLRRLSITMLLAVLVVGLAGLTALWLSTDRSQAITQTLDPAVAANGTALQLLTAAQSEVRRQLLAGARPVAPADPAASAGPVTVALDTVAQAGPHDRRVRHLLAAERAAATRWIGAAGAESAPVPRVPRVPRVPPVEPRTRPARRRRTSTSRRSGRRTPRSATSSPASATGSRPRPTGCAPWPGWPSSGWS